MAEEVENKQVLLKDYVNGFPKESDMEMRTNRIKLKLPEGSSSGQVLVKNLYLACDPYMRNRMSKLEGSYVHSFTPGSPVEGYGVVKVLDSTHQNFKNGDLVWGMTCWEEYSILTPAPYFLFKIEHTDVPLSYYTGILVPEGIDIYFENVGGKILDAAILNMKLNSRIAVCGMISQYNLEEPEGVQNLFWLVAKRIRMEGFLVVDYYHQYPEFLEMIIPLIKEGKISYVEDIVEGLENAPNALIGIFLGHNIGKKVIALTPE